MAPKKYTSFQDEPEQAPEPTASPADAILPPAPAPSKAPAPAAAAPVPSAVLPPPTLAELDAFQAQANLSLSILRNMTGKFVPGWKPRTADDYAREDALLAVPKATPSQTLYRTLTARKKGDPANPAGPSSSSQASTSYKPGHTLKRPSQATPAEAPSSDDEEDSRSRSVSTKKAKHGAGAFEGKHKSKADKKAKGGLLAAVASAGGVAALPSKAAGPSSPKKESAVGLPPPAAAHNPFASVSLPVPLSVSTTSAPTASTKHEVDFTAPAPSLGSLRLFATPALSSSRPSSVASTSTLTSGASVPLLNLTPVGEAGDEEGNDGGPVRTQTTKKKKKNRKSRGHKGALGGDGGWARAGPTPGTATTSG